MKKGRLLLTILFFLLSLSLCVMSGCSSDSSPSTGNDGGDGDGGDGGDTVVTLSVLDVTATPDSINPNESTTIEATSFDASGNTIAGVSIVFSLNDPSMASITGTATTDDNGVAQVSLTARNTSGEVDVTATSGDISSTPTTVTILGDGVSVDVPVAALYVTATPPSIDPNESTTIEANAYDASGNAISGVTITFTLDDPSMASITSTATTDTNGTAQVSLTARDISGNVNVTATSESISSTPTIVTILGGGVSVDVPVAALHVTATPNAINPNETTTIEVGAYDASGNTISGVGITFTLNDPSMASITSTATTGDNGTAQVSLTARDTSGDVNITATSGSISSTPSTVTILGGGTGTPIVSNLAIGVSNSSVSSDNVSVITVSASVLNSDNAAIPDVAVSFSASGGALSASSATTDESGIATVEFRAGLSDKTNHQVVIEAKTGTLSAQIPVLIDGTTVEASSSKTLLTIGGDNTDQLSIFVSDASGSAIYDADVTISVGSGSTGGVSLTPSSGKTDITGMLDVTVTGTNVGTATIQIAAAGAIDAYTYSVQSTGSAFGITGPTEDPASLEIDQQLTILVSDPIPGPRNQVVIATSLGSLMTDGVNRGPTVTVTVTDGIAQAQLLSSEAGVATVQAYDIDSPGITDSISVAMYATVADKISVQASSDVVATSTESLTNTVKIVANVLNKNDDVVGGAPVLFTLDNTTGGGEKISPTIVFTDESGTATATFASGSKASGGEGVTVTASVLVDDPDTVISDSISIVIGGEAGSVVIGTSTKISSINDDTAYQLAVSVLVSDANGNAVPGSTVSLGLWPAYYYTGYAYSLLGEELEYFGPFSNEDENKNTFLDPGEDHDGNGEITPQNSTAGSLPTVVTTDENGVATFYLVYLKQYASYVSVELTASTFVLGSETISTMSFTLAYSVSDRDNLPSSPFTAPLDFTPPDDEEYDTVSALHVTATPDAINPNETTTIEVGAYDASGNTVSGVDITFTLDDPSMASITSSATTGTDGTAQVTLTARGTSGEVNVTATSGSISSAPTTVTILGGGVSVDVTVAALDVIASPDAINPNETTTIDATAYDASGNTIAGVDIIFTLDDPVLAFITGAATTDNSGVAEVVLTARDKPGEVNVTATAITTDGNVSSTSPATVTILSGVVPSVINLTINPASILVEGTTTVQAEVLNANGDPVDDGTTVSFSSDNTLYGAFSSPTATTSNGFATATFEATNEQGTASVTVRSGNVSEQTSFTIYPAEATAIEFVSATPQRIPLQGSGGGAFTEASTILFIVKDSNGNPVEGKNVSFTLDGPNGGEFIDPTPGDPTPKQIDVSTNASGIAQVILNAGSVAGPTTIRATIIATDSQGNPVSISAQSSVVSIGGGVLSAKRFSVAATLLNLPGLEEEGIETEITAFLADRFGNYNVLQGTSVSFVSEIGLAIDTSDVTVDEDGIATVVARTQTPIAIGTPPVEDVAEAAWETELIDYLETVYGISLDGGHPRDGLCSVMVFAKGEEYFEDANANGIYDAGEAFTDTDDDPYIDANNNLIRDDGTSDPFEEYIDSGTANGVWDGSNGSWDADKNIFANFKFLITGQEIYPRADTPYFEINNGGAKSFTVIVCDRNGNPLVPGSSVSFSTTKGSLEGGTSFEFLNSSAVGPTMWGHLGRIAFGVTIADDDPSKVQKETATVSITVSWKGALGTVTTEYPVAQVVIDADQDILFPPDE